MRAIFDCKLMIDGNKATSKFSMAEAENMDPVQTAQILNEIGRLSKRVERILNNNANIQADIKAGESSEIAENRDDEKENTSEENLSE
jgi:hypothetical protein